MLVPCPGFLLLRNESNVLGEGSRAEVHAEVWTDARNGRHVRWQEGGVGGTESNSAHRPVERCPGPACLEENVGIGTPGCTRVEVSSISVCLVL